MAKEHYKEDLSEKERKRYRKLLSEEEELVLVTGYGSLYLRQKFILQILLPGIIFIIAGLAYTYFNHLNLGWGLGVGLAVAIIVAYLLTVIINRAHRYLLTTRRVIIREGIISLKITSVLYDKITHIEVDQGFTDRFFLHHGTIIINTAGGGEDLLTLKYVAYPVEFKNRLERLVHQERQGAPLRGEVIDLGEEK